MAALTRGARRVLVVVFLAFAAVGSYYAWTGPEGASSAERAPLMVVESSEAREPLRARSEAASRRDEAARPAPVSPMPSQPAPQQAEPIDALVAAAIEVVEVEERDARVVEDVIEILPPRAAAEFESGDVEPESSEPALVGGADPSPTNGGSVRRHRVQSGETLSSIAARHYGDASAWRRVAEANPGLDVDRLAIGMVILVPGLDPVLDPAPTPPVAAPEVPPSGRVHVVAEGETLSSIAGAVYGDSSLWRRLYEANRSAIGADPGAIRVGMRLVVPAE